MMDANTIVNLALVSLKAVLALVAEVKAQSGLTDDELLAHAKQLAGDNDALYERLKANLIP